MERFPVSNLGAFAAAPLALQNGQPVAIISKAQLAFEVLGPYMDPRMPQRGRFARLSGPKPRRRLGQEDPTNRLLGLPTQLLMDRYQVVFDEYDAGNSEKTVNYAQRGDLSARVWPLPGDFDQADIDILLAVRDNPTPDELRDLAMIDSVLLGPQVKDARDWMCGYPRDQGNWDYTPLYREFMYDTAGIRANPFFCPPGIVFNPPGLPRGYPSLGHGQRTYLQLTDLSLPWRDKKTQVRNTYLLFQALNNFPFPNPIPVLPAAWYNNPDVHTGLINLIKEPLPLEDDSALTLIRMWLTAVTLQTLEAVAHVIADELESELKDDLRMEIIQTVAVSIGIAILTAGLGAALATVVPSITIPGGLTVSTVSAVEALSAAAQGYMSKEEQEEAAKELAQVAELFRPDNPAFAEEVDKLKSTFEYLSGRTWEATELTQEEIAVIRQIRTERQISVENYGTLDTQVHELTKPSAIWGIGAGVAAAAALFFALR